ncbi:MAG: helix-turn-helix domain-containing protein [Oscillospiraceae bacterium]|jgi:transcriptional regulator with XRE-family HTH domain|nr:helix-turn-helix domain-containing protein [Oscillospiraceae bacterium]
MQAHANFGGFLSDRRRAREISSLQMSELAGISPGYYCDIEKGRKSAPDREILEKILTALRLPQDEEVVFYDLAGKSRSEVPPDLPDYIISNEVVRVALRIAREKGSADDWRQFIEGLEGR